MYFLLGLVEEVVLFLVLILAYINSTVIISCLVSNFDGYAELLFGPSVPLFGQDL
jgi:hypothetical protein